MKGKILKYFTYRRYGFIEVEDNEANVFFHISNYPVTSVPSVGQNVEFTLIETPKGLEAKEIRILEDHESTTESTEKVDATPVSENDLGELDGVGPKYQELLQAAGINSVSMLSSESPADLLDKLNTVNMEKEITKRPPTIENVEAWINQVNKL